MELETLLNTLSESPESVQFEDTMQVIEAHYDFSECEFRNGDVVNEAGQNNGSCKNFCIRPRSRAFSRANTSVLRSILP